MYNVTLRHIHELLLPWTSNKYYIFVCVCMHLYACGCLGICACVHVALPIEHSTHVPHIVTSLVATLTLPHFLTLSHKRCDYRKKVIQHKCVLISVQLLSKTFHTEKNLARCFINVKTCSREVCIVLVRF